MSVKITTHPALHRTRMPMSNATVKSGTTCPSNTMGKPGISKSQTSVDHTTVLLGKLIMRGFTAGRMFFIVVPFNTKIEIAPAPATSCVGGIAGFFGCVIMPHILCNFLMFDVTMIISSSLTTILFWVGYKVGFEPNDVTHLISTCSVPQCQLGNWLLYIAFVSRDLKKGYS